jgi:hypothetical protein
LVRSWPAVLAVTTPRVSRTVDIAHRMIQATSADLPMPWPEATATRIASAVSSRPAPRRCSTSRCQSLGALFLGQLARAAPWEGVEDEAQRIEAQRADLGEEALLVVFSGGRCAAFRRRH